MSIIVRTGHLLSLKEQIFGEKGYSSDLTLSEDELTLFRRLVSDQWLTTIKNAYPDLEQDARMAGIENYHSFADRVDHKNLWPKSNRVLPKSSVELIKKLPFINILRQEFGEFSISDVYDTCQHQGEEEVYWRLVRPGVRSDVGNLHVDKWFHATFNNGAGMFPDGVSTIKVWIPLYCERGKSGLAIVPGSHRRYWNFHVENKDGVLKPIASDDLSNAGAALMLTSPGNLLIFNENTLHGGAPNCGDHTRVSVEITMVMSSVKQVQHLVTQFKRNN